MSDCKCVVVGEDHIKRLLRRYDGIGLPITNVEREILLFFLYEENKSLGGLCSTLYAEDRR